MAEEKEEDGFLISINNISDARNVELVGRGIFIECSAWEKLSGDMTVVQRKLRLGIARLKMVEEEVPEG